MRKGMLVMMCGIPASGKSTYRNRLEADLVICPDDIRLNEFGAVFNAKIEPEVWDRAYLRLKMALVGGKRVIFDATNITKERRKKLLDIVRDTLSQCTCYYFDTPTYICKSRNMQRPNPIPEEVIDRMAENLEPPTKEEGIDILYYVVA